jgi:hypothetical protein
MASIQVKDAGTWKTASPQVKDAGTWKQVQQGWAKDAGTWKQFYLNVAVACADINAQKTSVTPANAVATLTILNDGTWSATNGSGTNTGTWLTAGTVSQVEVYFSGTGDTPTGSSLSTWLSCSSTRSWTLTNTSDAVDSLVFSGTLQFRDASSLTTLDTSAATITAAVIE